MKSPGFCILAIASHMLLSCQIETHLRAIKKCTAHFVSTLKQLRNFIDKNRKDIERSGWCGGDRGFPGWNFRQLFGMQDAFPTHRHMETEQPTTSLRNWSERGSKKKDTRQGQFRAKERFVQGTEERECERVRESPRVLFYFSPFFILHCLVLVCYPVQVLRVCAFEHMIKLHFRRVSK